MLVALIFFFKFGEVCFVVGFCWGFFWCGFFKQKFIHSVIINSRRVTKPSFNTERICFTHLSKIIFSC